MWMPSVLVMRHDRGGLKSGTLRRCGGSEIVEAIMATRSIYLRCRRDKDVRSENVTLLGTPDVMDPMHTCF